MTRRRTTAVRSWGALLGVLLIAACKREHTPVVTELWDGTEEGPRGDGGLAPTWPETPVRDLENGLKVVQVEEPGSQAVHLRLLLPTVEGGPAAAIAAAARVLQHEVQRRVTRHGATVDLTSGAGRVELGIHGMAQDGARLLASLSAALAVAPTAPRWRSARRALDGKLAPRSHEGEAAHKLVAALLGLEDAENVDRETLGQMTGKQLTDAWTHRTDPRRAVLLLHLDPYRTDTSGPLTKLATAWQRVGRGDRGMAATQRLRAVDPPTHKTRLLAAPHAPLPPAHAKASGRSTLFLGRVIPTPTAMARGFARLTQRVLQEDLDARLVPFGDHALFLVRVHLSAKNPDAPVETAIKKLRSYARKPYPATRLVQAAELWLGARLVTASLAGEDRTRLVSEALDLAESEAELHTVLGREARIMLGADPRRLQKWQARWFDPTAGEPGWMWVGSTATAQMATRLQKLETRVLAKPDDPGRERR